VVALTGVPAGGLADRFGAERVSRVGLGLMAVGSALLSLTAGFGVAGYVVSISVLTLGYALFQTSNNTVVMGRGSASDRGVTAGLLNLSRNLGLVTGASAMGALFALASGSSDVASASPAAVSLGMQVTFGVSALLILTGLVVGSAWRERVKCATCSA
jgi:MFS family permease